MLFINNKISLPILILLLVMQFRMKAQTSQTAKDRPTLKQLNHLQHPSQTKTGVIDSVKGYFTNLSYGFHGLFGKKQSPPANSLPTFILGQKHQTNEQCLKHHQSLIWFTYKKNCKISLTLCSVSSDIGWGCMIRVAQMAMAQALKRFFTVHNINIEKAYIIASFLESQNKPKYTISRFVDMANTLFLKQAGDCFSITEVAMIMQELHKERPLKGTEQMKILISDQTINIENASALLLNLNPQSQEKNKQYSQKFYKNKPALTLTQSKYSQSPSFNSLLLIVACKLGKQYPTDLNYKMLLELMNHPSFSGCLGGRPKQARFLTGRCGNKISYLDPHYVESEVQRINLQQQMTKFSCKDYRLMEQQELDPNVAVCFFIKDQTELYSLAKTIDELEGKVNGQTFIRCCSEKYQSKSPEKKKDTKPTQVNKYDFEQLDDDSFSEAKSGNNMQSSFFID